MTGKELVFLLSFYFDGGAGTPKGVGFARDPPVYLKHGDEVRCWISNGLGSLWNPVLEEKQKMGVKL
jgi:hypothetical protein